MGLGQAITRALATSLAAAAGFSATPSPVAGPPLLTKFVDPLPIPPRVRLGGLFRHHYTVTLSQFQTQLHRDLPPTTEWGYNGSSPGPTIEVETGHWLEVRWRNELPATHLFPLPHGADAINPDVRSVTHLHGAVVTQPNITDKLHDNDGWPDAWITPGEEQLARYPNHQSARTLWYHDHAMGETGRNVAAGLIGLYEIHDDYERSLNLPAGDYELPLMLQAKQVNADGSLGYSGDITAEFYGNAVAVNGKLWPRLDVEPRKYRFRVVNASNARSYALKLIDPATNASGPAFYQIGSDGGFLAETAVLNDPATPGSPRLTLAPAERADVIVDFSAFAGRTLLLHNNSHDPSDGEISLPDLMQVRVAAAASGPDASSLPMVMRPIPRIDPATASVTRTITFDQMTMDGVGPMPILNGKHWQEPISERPVLGATEIWQLLNTLIDTHPFHIHLVEFQVLDRTLFDVAGYLATGKVTFVAPPVPPAPNERGWKDVIRVMPQMVTRIIMRFTPFPGFYVYHCHILEHEDMDMMRPFEIVKNDPMGDI